MKKTWVIANEVVITCTFLEIANTFTHLRAIKFTVMIATKGNNYSRFWHSCDIFWHFWFLNGTYLTFARFLVYKSGRLIISQTFFSKNLVTVKVSQHTIFKSQDIGWSVKLAYKEIRITSHTFGQNIYIFMVSRTLILSLPVTWCAGHNSNLPLNSNILKTVRVKIAFTLMFLKSIQ